VEWYHVCWPRLTAKRVEPVVSISWASCFQRQTFGDCWFENFLTSRMHFLLPKQQRQSSEWNRNTYWRRESIQDGQATASVHRRLWRPVRKRFFCDNFVIFRHIGRKNIFLESVNFSTCVYVQLFNFRDGHMIGLRVRYKYYRKKHSRFGLAWSRPHANRGL